MAKNSLLTLLSLISTSTQKVSRSSKIDSAETRKLLSRKWSEISSKAMPDIQHIITPDQGRYHGCCGHLAVKAPNQDALASEGVRFTNHSCASAP
ncbi:MAG: hypothetical protein ACYC27_12500 [Armatimonadota bacterium]